MPQKRNRKCSATITQKAPSGLSEQVPCPRLATQTIDNKPLCDEHAGQISKAANAKQEPPKMNEIATRYGSQSVATVGRDPFEILADEMAPQNILGTLIKFSKGDYLAGADSELVPAGTVFLAATDHCLGGHVHWADGRPDQQLMTPLASGQRPPPRYTLGDNDKATWETVGNAKRDPWQETYYLPLLSAEDELYTFTTSSAGGIRTIGSLFREYGKHRRTGADEYPLIALDVGSFVHREYGRIKKPEFRIAGWEPRTRFLDALAAAGIAPLDIPPAAPPPPPAAAPAPGIFVPNKRARGGVNIKEEMNDEIPY